MQAIQNGYNGLSLLVALNFDRIVMAVAIIVGLVGGLGGFVLPILFGVIVDLTGINSGIFMLMYGVTWVSLIWMYLTEVGRGPMIRKTAAIDTFK